MSSAVDVYKFGGVAVGSAEAIRTALDHVSRAERLVVVVSAINGITDQLINAGEAALEGNRTACDAFARGFQERHAALLPELFPDGKRRRELRKLISEAGT